MTTETLVIPGNRPLAIKRVIDALNSGPKLKILRILLDRSDGVTASEIANILKIKLSTTLSHLADLVKAGLVVVKSVKEDNRVVKKYFLAAKTITLEIDLEFFLKLDEKGGEEELREIESLALQYIDKKRSQGLPLAISVKDVSRVLGVDTGTAIKVVDYINTYTDKIIEYLLTETLSILEKKKTSSIRELARELGVHEYWMALVVQKMVNKGFVVVESDGRVVLVSRT